MFGFIAVCVRFVYGVPVLFKHLSDCGDQFVGDKLIKFFASQVRWANWRGESMGQKIDRS
jgi:hypothetical protein